jgi:transcriptional regulator with XRE-family HTH domain
MGEQMESPGKNFDAEAFYAAIAATVVARGVTWKQVSRDTGISATTLTRMAQGRHPDAASLAALSAWAGVNPANFVRLDVSDTQPEPLAQISALLRSDQRLKPEAVRTLDVMIRTAYGQLRETHLRSSPASRRPRRRSSRVR